MSTTTYGVEQFIGDVKRILAEQGPDDRGLERIAERMRELALSHAGDRTGDEVAGNVHTGRQSKPLYTDESGLTLVRARFATAAPFPMS